MKNKAPGEVDAPRPAISSLPGGFDTRPPGSNRGNYRANWPSGRYSDSAAITAEPAETDPKIPPCALIILRPIS